TPTLLAADVRSDFFHPYNPGNALGFDPVSGRRSGTYHAQYDPNDPLRKILLTAGTGALSKTGTGLNWFLNFDDTQGPLDIFWNAGSGYPSVPTDGNDDIFGDLGNDWAVGGTGRDTLWGGWGNDELNADDKLSDVAVPDTNPSYEDLAYGGAGLDILIANTGGDRLIDW